MSISSFTQAGGAKHFQNNKNKKNRNNRFQTGSAQTKKVDHSQSRVVFIVTRPSGSNLSGNMVAEDVVGSFEELCALRGTQKMITGAINVFFATRDPPQALARTEKTGTCLHLKCPSPDWKDL